MPPLGLISILDILNLELQVLGPRHKVAPLSLDSLREIRNRGIHSLIFLPFHYQLVKSNPQHKHFRAEKITAI